MVASDAPFNNILKIENILKLKGMIVINEENEEINHWQASDYGELVQTYQFTEAN